MDPVTHTLVGAALAETGLKRRTALGTTALLIGANLPDIDVASYALGSTFALTFRRGWTHGVLALVVLPMVLTGLLMIWDVGVRRRRDPAAAPAIPRQLLLLSTLAVFTHPLLDVLNVYGMRFLMPFSGRWFYGDTLFIVDPWVWAMLAAGVVLARRWNRWREPGVRSTKVHDGRPAYAALAAMLGYIAAMATSMLVARAGVERALEAESGADRAIMVAPVAVNPFRRYVVIAEAETLRIGTVDWWRRPRFVRSELATIARRTDAAGVAAARATERGGQFLQWARFPFYEVGSSGNGGLHVHIMDARYAVEPDAPFGALTVEVDAP